MSITNPATSASLTAGRAVRTGGLVLAASIVVNLVALAVARLAGAEMEVLQPGADEATEVGAVPVLISTVAPLLVGTAVLALASHWGRTGWSTLAWVGLALGVLSAVAPLAADATAGTRVTLVIFHLVLGVAWFTALRRDVIGTR